MKIRLEDDALTGQLLAFLRDRECIAYYESASGAIEAIAPDLFDKDEAEMIRTLVARWQAERPGVTIEIED
jgi:Na+-translocating ferredoxin:NAD+ oxidoreductase RnfC subunit